MIYNVFCYCAIFLINFISLYFTLISLTFSPCISFFGGNLQISFLPKVVKINGAFSLTCTATHKLKILTEPQTDTQKRKHTHRHAHKNAYIDSYTHSASEPVDTQNAVL